MGGSFSHEFMIPAEVGDNDVFYNEESGYAANREKARSLIVPEGLVDAAPSGALEEFPTPGVVTIAALEAAPSRRSPPQASSRPLSSSATAARLSSSCAGATSSRRPSWAPWASRSRALRLRGD